MNEIYIDWTKQHNGVHQASVDELRELMPDLIPLIDTFPETPSDFVWDVKVHMLMPSQYPCIPNWHYDNIPRINNVQDFNLIQPDKPMYLWLSGNPVTEFRDETGIYFVKEKTWFRFTQRDEHRGSMSRDFQWRGFIRATHKDICPQRPRGHNPLRRHSQVYLDVNNFSW